MDLSAFTLVTLPIVHPCVDGPLNVPFILSHFHYRPDIAAEASQYADYLKPDEGCEYDELIEIDLSTLEFHFSSYLTTITGPTSLPKPPNTPTSSNPTMVANMTS